MAFTETSLLHFIPSSKSMFNFIFLIIFKSIIVMTTLHYTIEINHLFIYNLYINMCNIKLIQELKGIESLAVLSL